MRPLIYDVGMHNGADTDFYLRKGFDVAAIEANPDYVARARERFASEIAEGRLVIHDVALTETAGEVSFFVHEHDDWSRLDVDLDHRFPAGTYREIKVRGMPFQDIVRGHRAPYYVKLDIEGPERMAIGQMFSAGVRPPFLSFEANLETGPILELLEANGYGEFQLLGQLDKSWIRLPSPPLEGDFCDVRFDTLMSGPFGRELPGRWVTRRALREQLDAHAARVREGDPVAKNEWHDVHARRTAAPRRRRIFDLAGWLARLRHRRPSVSAS